MGLLDLIFGQKKTVHIEDGIWLKDIREMTWTVATPGNSRMPGLHIAIDSLFIDNGNRFFVLKQLFTDPASTKYLGCIWLAQTQDIMVVVERIEAADQQILMSDAWAYERFLNAQNTPQLDQLLDLLTQQSRTSAFMKRPDYLQYIIQGLETMTG
jgi:hypothetical protein